MIELTRALEGIRAELGRAEGPRAGALWRWCEIARRDGEEAMLIASDFACASLSKVGGVHFVAAMDVGMFGRGPHRTGGIVFFSRRFWWLDHKIIHLMNDCGFAYLRKQTHIEISRAGVGVFRWYPLERVLEGVKSAQALPSRLAKADALVLGGALEAEIEAMQREWG